MKKLIFTLVAIVGLVVLVASCCSERKENPRGVYKLVSLIGTDKKEIPAPFEQYKICTDSITWTLFIDEDGSFRIIDNDHWTFNYTGEEPDAEEPHRARVFDSDANGFRLKWWSEYKDNEIFPADNWCTEIYQAGQLTPTASLIIDALTKPVTASPDQPLLGQWHFVGHDSEEGMLNGSLNWIDSRDLYPFTSLLVLTENHCISDGWGEGRIHPVRYISDEELEFTDTRQTLHLLPGHPDILLISAEEIDAQIAAELTDADREYNELPAVWVRTKDAATMIESLYQRMILQKELLDKIEGRGETE